MPKKLSNWLNSIFFILGVSTLPFLNNFRNFDASLYTLKIASEVISLNDYSKTLVREDMSGSKDIYIFGPNSDIRYRIYMDSSGDRDLPKLNQEVKDYIIGKGKKDLWYEHLIPGLTLDIKKYSSSKEDFLRSYKTVTFSYFYNFNLWNSKEGWTYEHGKYTPALIETLAFSLTSQNEEKLLFYEKDSNHKNNESARLILKQQWEGDLLTYNFYLGVSYHWQAGSLIKHASLAQFYNDYYSFTSIPPTENQKDLAIDKIQKLSKFSISPNLQDVSFANFDKEIKEVARRNNVLSSPFKTTTIFVQGYSGIKKVGNTIHILSMRLIWEDSINIDSTFLLNGVGNLGERKMTARYDKGYLNFSYEGFSGEKLNEEKEIPYETMIDMKMEGNFYLPFVYIK